MKLPTVRYLSPKSSTNEIAVTLGNPDVGKPIAQEHKSAAPIINKFG
jgi:hypothetical protein